ncbi:MFS transporter (macronuclear) [Tetrahymena thermophila SB210]|uniref:Hexose transporter 1 n=1 Tax=Tetrahymena thermophila (strain SB210) TaxID=312017 RepID=Q247Y7_TETTS|nr:MFS transporter [Tetrahymena thermophila SB210]EAS04158.1 MFS transporter [Tetrahymena thermophila SB210]|eukprot:XP_001024403.1 MFS transporter [Tetrahymena thermophila SB210]
MDAIKFDSSYPINQVNQFIVYFRAIIISLGGLFFGYNNGCFNPTQEHISNLNKWYSSFDVALYTGLVTCFLPFGCLFGSLLSNFLLKITQSNLRVCLALTDVIGILGTVIQIIDPNLGNLILGRFLNGVAGGFNTSIVPIYLINFTPVIMRGKTGTFVQSFASLGLFIGLSLGAIQPRYPKVPKVEPKEEFIQNEIDNMDSFHLNLAWRITIGLPILLCFIRLLSLIFIFKEETPIQMVKHNHLRTLRRYLEKCYDKERADLRFKEIVNYANQHIEEDDKLSEGDEIDVNVPIQFSNQANNDQQKNNKNNEYLISMQNHNEQNKEHKYQVQNDTSNHDNLDIKQPKSEKEKFEINLASSNISNHSVEVLENKKIDNSKKQNKLPQIFKSQRRRKMLGVVLQMTTQLSGLNALMFFSSSIFKANSDNPDTVQLYLYIQGFSIFFFTFISIFFIENFGRKKLILGSTFLTLIGLLGIAIFALVDIFVVSFIFIIFFLFGFGIGLGAVVWPFCTELVNKEDLPICSAARWFSALLIGICFRFLVLAIGISGTFFLFFGFTLLAFIYFLKEMKETKGMTIEQVDQMYS